MSKGKNQHVVPRGDKFAVLGAGNSRATKLHDTQTAARTHAREIAINQKSELIVHRPNGQIREKNTYGKDPNPPRG